MPSYLTFNFDGTQIRTEKLDGEDHLVVPFVSLLEGVHAGSDGAGYYPANEIESTPQLWNHKPIVVYHPEDNGKGVTASSPQIINTRQIGLILNSKYGPTAASLPGLGGEAWMNIKKTQAVDGRIITKLQAGEKVEVSTGLVVKHDWTKGEWRGEKYDFIARNHQPDHLAILPDRIGACSIADGGGLLANNAKEPERNQQILNRSAQLVLKAAGLVLNEMSFSSISCQLSDQLASRFGEPGKYWDGYIVDVYSDVVIYKDAKYDYYLIGYTATDAGVSLSGDPVEVVRVTSYSSQDGKKTYVRNEGTATASLTLETSMSTPSVKDKHLVTLIGNGGYTEADRSWLAAMPEDQLVKIKPITANTTPAPAPNMPVVPGALPIPTATQVVTAPVPGTIEEFLKTAPPAVAAVLQDGLTTMQTERASLVKKISEAPGNRFPAEFLNNSETPMNTLRGIASIIDSSKPAPTHNAFNGPNLMPPNYAGQGPLFINNTAPAGSKEAPLISPTLNFASDNKTAA